MPALARYGSNALAAFLDAPDVVYGSGSDGNVTISTNTTMTRDMFYNNLTVNSSITLNTGAYRLFVKGLLTLGDATVVGFTNGSSAIGSIYGGGAATTSVTASLGGAGNGGTYTAIAPTAAVGGTQWYDQANQAVLGYSITPTGITWLRGGAGGSTGAGGGVVIVAARYIACTATSTNALFSAPGGTSNGGGGVVIIVSSRPSLPSNVGTTVAGAGTGSAGTSKYIQLV